MKFQKFILNIVLGSCSLLVKILPINDNKICFVSLENEHLTSDLKLIYDALDQKKYKLVCVLTSFKKKDISNSLRYFFNTIKQIFVINTSKLVLINDNNYVISNFKREGVTVIQVWHAAGAVKKFGNVLPRKYKIANYDYVIANGKYWQKPYSKAFGVKEDQVILTGMPRLDELSNPDFLAFSKIKLIGDHPELFGKKVILYAPTFRGDIYRGISFAKIDLDHLSDLLGSDYMIICKWHPLIHDTPRSCRSNVVDLSSYDIHQLFAISDVLVSDFSSVIFDYSLLGKRILYYVPDLEEYQEERGCFVDYAKMTKGCLAQNEKELAEMIKDDNLMTSDLKNEYLEECDGHSLKKITERIYSIMK